MMDTWIFQQGFPIVSADADGRWNKVSSLASAVSSMPPPESPEAQLWHVPVMVRASTDKGVRTHKLLLTGDETTLELPRQSRMGDGQ